MQEEEEVWGAECGRLMNFKVVGKSKESNEGWGLFNIMTQIRGIIVLIVSRTTQDINS